MVAITERPTSPSNEKEKMTLKMKLILAAGGASVLAAALFGGIAAASDDEKPKAPETSTSIEPEVVVNSEGIRIQDKTPAQTEVNTIATGETLNLLQEHSKNFDDWRELTLDILKRNNMLSVEEQTFLDTQYATLSQKSDKSTYTNNEVLAAVAIDVADAGSQEEPDFEIGGEMLPLVVSRNRANFNEVNEIITNPHAGTVVDIYREDSLELQHPQGAFMDEKIENVKDARVIIQTKIAGTGNRTDVFTEAGLYILNSDGKGNEQWQSVERYGLDDPEAQAAVDTLRANP